MKSKKVFYRTAALMGVLILLTTGMAWTEGTHEPVTSKQVIQFGIKVEAPVSLDGVKIMVENKEPKLFKPYQGSNNYFRVLTNIDMYGLDNNGKRKQIGVDFKPNIFIEILYSQYDIDRVKKLDNLLVLFWVPENSEWKTSHDLENNGELKRVKSTLKNSIRFQVLKWPLNDRYIAYGG